MPGIRRSQTARRAVVLVEELERLARVVEGAHGEPRLFEGDRHRLAGAGLVVDHQNQGFVGHSRVILAQTGPGVERVDERSGLKPHRTSFATDGVTPCAASRLRGLNRGQSERDGAADLESPAATDGVTSSSPRSAGSRPAVRPPNGRRIRTMIAGSRRTAKRRTARCWLPRPSSTCGRLGLRPEWPAESVAVAWRLRQPRPLWPSRVPRQAGRRSVAPRLALSASARRRRHASAFGDRRTALRTRSRRSSTAARRSPPARRRRDGVRSGRPLRPRRRSLDRIASFLPAWIKGIDSSPPAGGYDPPLRLPRDPRRRDHPGRGSGADRLLQRGERLERGAAPGAGIPRPGDRGRQPARRAAGGEPAPQRRAGSTTRSTAGSSGSPPTRRWSRRPSTGSRSTSAPG